MLLKYKKIFSIIRKLVTSIYNYLKKEIIKVFKCLSIWYKQKLALAK